MPDQYCKKSPCANCPYRKDAPLRLWSSDEFKDLLAADKDYMGKVYGCHKNDGKICTGWLMNQDARNHPSIRLRMSLSKNNVTRKFLDSLHCKTPLFKTIQEMAHANYPELFPSLTS